MAGTKRIADTDLIERLAREGRKFDFFRVVDLLERAATEPDMVPVGHSGPAEREVIRFEHDPELVFHTSDVRWVKLPHESSEQRIARVKTTFLGLFGVVSPLPITMTEDVLTSEGAEESGLREFYDIFHHRILGLFFRAWQKSRFEASHRADTRDPFTTRALCFVGVDSAGAPRSAQPGPGLPPIVRLGIAPLLARRSRTVQDLRAVLARLLPGVPAEIECFVLRRTQLLADQLVALGVRNTTLGRDIAIGASVADRSGRFRVVLGPLTQEQYAAVSPGGAHHRTLSTILDHFSGGILEVEVEVLLGPDQVPRFELGGPRGASLGRTTRLASSEQTPFRSSFIVTGPG